MIFTYQARPQPLAPRSEKDVRAYTISRGFLGRFLQNVTVKHNSLKQGVCSNSRRTPTPRAGISYCNFQLKSLFMKSMIDALFPSTYLVYSINKIYHTTDIPYCSSVDM